MGKSNGHSIPSRIHHLPVGVLPFHVGLGQLGNLQISQDLPRDVRERSSCHLISSLPRALAAPAAFTNGDLLVSHGSKAHVRSGFRLAGDVAAGMYGHKSGSERNESAALRQDHEQAVKAFRQKRVFIRLEQLETKTFCQVHLAY